MAQSGSKGDAMATLLVEMLELVCTLQQNMQHTETQMQRVEEASKGFGETQKLMDEKLDDIHKLISQWNSTSDTDSLHKSPPLYKQSPPSQTHLDLHTTLTVDELAFLRKQEAVGKISLHTETFPNTTMLNHHASTLDPNQPINPCFVYTHIPPHTKPIATLKTNQTSIPPNQTPIDMHRHHTNTEYNPHFNLSIARPKLDFPDFSGDKPFNWLRHCEKYFTLASVPIETWVPLATFHCFGLAQSWWRSLRTPTNYVHWTRFCTMASNRFSLQSQHNSLENFHHLKQTWSVAEYIQRCETLMALIQMDYPGLNEAYFVSSFIAGLRDGIKHYLIPHCPSTLCDTY
jgi:hypothetical protein